MSVLESANDRPAEVRCAYCGATVPDTEAAMEADWEPYFYGDDPADDREFGPCCPECRGAHLTWDDDLGASVARPGHTPAAD